MRMRISFFIFVVLSAAVASASNPRSAVSVTGLDTNPCTVASPCRSFGAAMTATSIGGEIVALSSAGYGPFNIPMSVTISGAPGVHAAITVTSGNGITHTGSTGGNTGDVIALRNLVLIGAGGNYGIDHEIGTDLVIANCLIRGFTLGGIYSDDFDGRLAVDHCSILDNGAGYGIYTDGGYLITDLTVRNCLIEGNGQGVFIGYNTRAAITDTVVTNNSICGIQGYNVNQITQTATQIMVENCTIAHNAIGLYAAATLTNNSVTINLSRNLIAYNGTGAGAGANMGAVAVVNSYGNNRFVSNTSDGGPFPTVSFQ